MQQIPLVTVVMPVRNEAAYIKRSLEAVLAQDYPAGRLEVVVADGMSTDSTAEIIRSFTTRFNNVRMINNPGRIVPTGMNLAIQNAGGEIIVRVDGHCEVAPDYVRRCVDHLRGKGVDAVGGPLETIGESATANVISMAMSSKFGVGGSAFRTISDRTMFTDTVAFPAYKRSAIERIGPFDEELVRNQDDEYNYRLRKLGGRILLADDVRCRYYSRGSLRSLWRQYFQYGYWKVRVMQKHPRQMKLRHFVPACLILALAATVAAIPMFNKAAWVLLVLVASYLFANIFAAVMTVRKIRPATLVLLSAAFFVLHFSYGLGFIVGLVRFRNRWQQNRTAVTGWSDVRVQKETGA